MSRSIATRVARALPLRRQSITVWWPVASQGVAGAVNEKYMNGPARSQSDSIRLGSISEAEAEYSVKWKAWFSRRQARMSRLAMERCSRALIFSRAAISFGVALRQAISAAIPSSALRTRVSSVNLASVMRATATEPFGWVSSTPEAIIWPSTPRTGIGLVPSLCASWRSDSVWPGTNCPVISATRSSRATCNWSSPRWRPASLPAVVRVPRRAALLAPRRACIDGKSVASRAARVSASMAFTMLSSRRRVKDAGCRP